MKKETKSLPLFCDMCRLLLDHGDALFVSAAVEGGVDKNFREFDGFFAVDDASAEAENVCVVVAAGHFRAELVRQDGSADAFLLVGGDGHADARSATEDAEGAVTALNRGADFFCIDGVIDGLGGVGAEVNVVDAFVFEVFDDGVLDFQAAVITAESEFHDVFLSLIRLFIRDAVP